ncbi:MAG: hypothetical protein JJE09_12380 [Bacteroidia bacterium]|nr:hypothetical protein [Bacteroidia bacterium]
MKKHLTLFLLFLFLLNMLGYYGVFLGMQVQTTMQMRHKFDDQNYSHQEVIFKIPLAIPYSTDSKEYTRVDGEFEHNGDVYRLVKQRLQSDTLYIVCIKDNTSKRINQALEDYVKTFTDKPYSSKGKSKSFNNLIKDFLTTSLSIEKQNSGWEKVFDFFPIEICSDLITLSHTGPPPRA